MNDGEIALQVANSAMLRIESHEEQCKERYDEIRRSQVKGESDREELRRSTEQGFEKVREAVSAGHDKIYSRMWSMQLSMFATVIVVAGALGLILLAYIKDSGGIQ